MYFSRVRFQPEIHTRTQLIKIITHKPYELHRLLWDLFPADNSRQFLYREEVAREQLGIRSEVKGESIYYIISRNPPNQDNPLFKVDIKEYKPQLEMGNLLTFKLRANPVITHSLDRENPEQYLKARNQRNVEDPSKLTKRRVRHNVVVHAQRLFLIELCTQFKIMNDVHPRMKKSELKRILLNNGGEALDEYLASIITFNGIDSDLKSQFLSINNKLDRALILQSDQALEKWIETQGQRYGFKICVDRFNEKKLHYSGHRWNNLSEKYRGRGRAGFDSVDFSGELEIIDPDLFTNALFAGIGPAKAFGCGMLMIRRV